jgi:hypothetical protein
VQIANLHQLLPAFIAYPEELGDGLGLLDGLADIQFDCLGKGKVEKR